MDKNKQILIAGDVILDRFVIGSINKLSPEAPVPILNCLSRKDLLGGASNVAYNIKNVDGNPYLVGAIGEDESGKKISELLNQNNINNFLVYSKRQTTTKTRYCHQIQQVLRVDYEDIDPIEEKTENKILEFTNNINPDLILISDYNKGTLTPKIFAALKNKNINIISNIKPYNIQYVQHTFAIIINNKEYEQISYMYKTYSPQELREILDVDNLIVTKGSSGFSWSNNENTFEFAAEKTHFVSSVGAGDTFSAFFALGIVNNQEVIDSLLLANKAAGISVSKHGTSGVERNEIFNE